MKKVYLLALILTLGYTVAEAQTTPPATAPAANQKVVTDGPVLTFLESKFDFGKIQEGEVVTHIYKFRNTGNQPLLISDVRVTCGCTSPDWTKTPVPPGQTGFVAAQFNSIGKSGQNQKVVTVISNSVTGNTQISFIVDVAPKGSGSSASDMASPAGSHVQGNSGQLNSSNSIKK